MARTPLHENSSVTDLRNSIGAVSPAIALYVVLLVAALCYWPGLSGDLVLDDYNNLGLLDEVEAGKLEISDFLISGASAERPGRPVARASFLANWLASGPDVWVMKYTNLMIHLLCGTLLFWLAGRLFAERAAERNRRCWWFALWVAAAWLLAPLLVSTVLYVVQRMAQLAALFVIAGLLSYVIGRQRMGTRFVSGIILVVLSLAVFWPLAVFSKENGALLPLLLLIVEYFFFRFRGQPHERRAAIAATVLPTLVAAITVLVLIVHDPGRVTGGYAVRDFTLWERLLTQPRALFDYLANLLLLPGGSGMSLYHDDFPVSAGLLDPPTTLASLLAIAVLLAGAWWFRRTGGAVHFFGPLFFLAAHLVESTVFPLEPYFEHRNYLPAVGILLGIAVSAQAIMPQLRRPKLVIVVLAILPLLYLPATYVRVQIWQSRERMLLAAERTHPGSVRVHTELASVYMNRGDLQRAFAYLDRAAELDADRGTFALDLHRIGGYCVTRHSAPETAYRRLRDGLPLVDDHYTVNALAWLAGAAVEQRCNGVDVRRVALILGGALERGEVIEQRDQAWLLHWHTARLLLAAGEEERARRHSRIAERMRP